MKKLYSILTMLILTMSMNLQASDYSYNQINLSSNKIVKKFINNQNCNQILTNNNYFTNCYDYDLKSTIYSYSKLYSSKINSKNIKKRPRFYDDLKLPKKYRTKYSDYTHTKIDRGHLITANDASWDWSKKSQKATYVMSNIVPQYPNTNRKSYLKVEKYSRQITNKLNELEIFQKINFINYPKRIGRNKVAVPESFSIMLFNTKENFERCFNVPNDNKVYKLKEMEINCKYMLYSKLLPL